MTLYNFLSVNGSAPRTVPDLQVWLNMFVALASDLATYRYVEDTSAPTIPDDLDAVFPEGREGSIVVWYRTDILQTTIYFGVTDHWHTGPTSGGPTTLQVPAGTVIDYLGKSAATAALVATGDWLYCDGSEVSRVLYADLFGAIGEEFGVGDGFSTFNLPDLRGYAVAGMDDMGTGAGAANVVTDASADTLGGAMGEETHLLSTTEIPPHTHTLDGYTSSNRMQVAGAGDGIEAGTPENISTNSGGGSGNAHNNMQPTTFGYKLIKT